jgi:hypothetical protein
MSHLSYEQDAQLGDATSDVTNATLLAFMVLTVMLTAALMAMLIVFNVNSEEIVSENVRLKQEIAQLQAQFNKPPGGTQIISGLQLWESPKREHFLTDIRSEENWCKIPIRYQCTRRSEENVEHLVCPADGEEGSMKSKGVLPTP